MADDQGNRFDIERVLAATDNVTGNRDASLKWLQLPLKAFGEKTPETLIAEGKADDVIAYLDSVSSGFVG